MKRTACSACGYNELVTFLDLGLSPIADNYQRTDHGACALYPLQLAVCTGCWLVQLLEMLPGELLFESGYSFYSSSSPPLSKYHADYALAVLAQNPNNLKDGILEIGCNDGDFLKHFKKALDPDVKVMGVDPAAGPTSVAKERHHLGVIDTPFSSKTADTIVETWGEFGVVVANHVLAHVEDVSDVLEGFAKVLKKDGRGYIEVQYLPDLLLNNAFDLAYHEHRNFFSLTSLQSACERWGLQVTGVQLTDRQGGSLRAEVGFRPVPNAYRNYVLAQEAIWLRNEHTYAGFQGRAIRIKDRLVELIRERGRVWGYGAPAKATTLLNFCELTVDDIPAVYDTTEAKQFRFIPGTGIPIKAPTKLESDRAYLILSWNYSSFIMRRHKRFAGEWIVPFPAPIVY